MPAFASARLEAAAQTAAFASVRFPMRAFQIRDIPAARYGASGGITACSAHKKGQLLRELSIRLVSIICLCRRRFRGAAADPAAGAAAERAGPSGAAAAEALPDAEAEPAGPWGAAAAEARPDAGVPAAGEPRDAEARAAEEPQDAEAEPAAADAAAAAAAALSERSAAAWAGAAESAAGAAPRVSAQAPGGRL